MPRRRTGEIGPNGPKDTPQKHRLPDVTPLQFLVLDLLDTTGRPVSAHNLKKGIASVTPDYDGPKFYQLLSRMAVAGLVRIESRTIDVSGGTIERSFYEVTDTGRTTLSFTRHFYETRHSLMETLSSGG